jgi:endonuclease IV
MVHDQEEQSDEDFLNSSHADDVDYIARLRKGDSKAAIKRWVLAILKMKEKKVTEIEYAIEKAKAVIRYNKYLDSGHTSVRIYDTMKRIQSFETQLGKAKRAIAFLQDLLIEFKDESTDEFQARSYERKVITVLNKPAFRPLTRGMAAA